MGLASIIVLGVVGFGVLTLVAGIVDAEWELRQRNKKDGG
ncbi:hypothetical protein ES703_75177 [subsurface metagenome]